MNADRTAARIHNAFAHAIAAGDLTDSAAMAGGWVFTGEFTESDGTTTMVVLHSDARTSVRLGMLDFARELALRDAFEILIDEPARDGREVRDATDNDPSG